MNKKAFATLALIGALASAHADTTLISQGFDNVSTLTSSGWIIQNLGTAGGVGGLSSPWVQGGSDTAITAQAGPSDSYITSNFNNVVAGGTLASWLISPVFSTTNTVTISFWATADYYAGYSDMLKAGLVDASGNTTNFSPSFSFTASTNGWNQYTMTINGTGTSSTARFAIEYFGAADSSNLVAVDSVNITTVSAVPEVSSWQLMGLGMLAMGTIARRRKQA